MPAEGGQPQPLPCVDLFHEPPKRSKPAIVRRPFSDAEPFVAWQGWFTREFVLKQPWLLLYALCTSSSSLKRFQCVWANGTPELCGSWVDLSKLVSRQRTIVGPRVVVRSVLDQGTRTRVIGAASGTKHHTCGLPPKPKQVYYTSPHLTTSSCHARNIINSGPSSDETSYKSKHG